MGDQKIKITLVKLFVILVIKLLSLVIFKFNMVMIKLYLKYLLIESGDIWLNLVMNKFMDKL